MTALLASHYRAHLGCCDGNEPYVVPISYVLHSNTLLGYTHPGRKIELMRKNPRVCVQVEDIGEDEWVSVIVMGDFEELKGKERMQAIHHLGQNISHPQNHFSSFFPQEIIQETQDVDHGPIIYRIKITSMTGRKFGGSAEAD